MQRKPDIGAIAERTPLSSVAPRASDAVEMHYGFFKVSDFVEVFGLGTQITHHNKRSGTKYQFNGAQALNLYSYNVEK